MVMTVDLFFQRLLVNKKKKARNNLRKPHGPQTKGCVISKFVICRCVFSLPKLCSRGYIFPALFSVWNSVELFT